MSFFFRKSKKNYHELSTDIKSAKALLLLDNACSEYYSCLNTIGNKPQKHISQIKKIMDDIIKNSDLEYKRLALNMLINRLGAIKKPESEQLIDEYRTKKQYAP